MDVLQKAGELGQALAGSEIFQKFMAARERIDTDPVASELIPKYHAKEEEIMQAMALDPQNTTQAVDKLNTELEIIRQQIQQNEVHGELMTAQADFQSLMEQVNDVIGRFINPNAGCNCGEGGCDPNQCGGGCSGCH